MKTATAQLLASKKFWTTIIGTILTLGSYVLAKWGLEVDDAAVQQISGSIAVLFSVLLLGQGLTDQGKEAAKQRNGQSGHAALGALLFAAVIGALVLMAIAQTGCSAVTSSAKRVAGDTADCLKPEPAALAEEFKPAMLSVVRAAVMNDGKVDWDQLRPVASALKTVATRCVFVAALAEVGRIVTPDPNAPQSSALEVDQASLRGGFEGVRSSLFGGQHFKLDAETVW